MTRSTRALRTQKQSSVDNGWTRSDTSVSVGALAQLASIQATLERLDSALTELEDGMSTDAFAAVGGGEVVASWTSGGKSSLDGMRMWLRAAHSEIDRLIGARLRDAP
jgi:hypothetical protein